MRRHLEACALCPEHTPPLYPAGRYSLWDQGAAARFHYSFPFQFDPVRWSGHVGAERRKTQALLRAYFALGNQQIQINVVDQALLQAAIADPGAYRDLVVRVAGYSEYFDRLTPALRQSVLERTIHTL